MKRLGRCKIAHLILMLLELAFEAVAVRGQGKKDCL